MRTVFDYELKTHLKYLDSIVKKHIETAAYNLKHLCIINIRNINLISIQVTNGQLDHIAHLQIEADCIDLKVGEVHSGIITHAILNKQLVAKIENLITVFVDFEPNYKIGDSVLVKITNKFHKELLRKNSNVQLKVKRLLN